MSQASEADPRRLRIGLKLLLLVALWTIPGLLFGSQLFFHERIRGVYLTSWDWLGYVVWQLVGWYFWAPVTPFVLLLGRRFPLRPPRLLRGLALHLFVASLMTFAFAAWNTLFARPIAPSETVYELDPWWFMDAFLSQRFHTSLLTYFLILGVGYGIDFYRQQRARELRASQLEAQLAQAQLEALKMQLHPHFLFNTLNGIAMLVRKGGQREAVSMLAGLSDLLRLALENSGTQLVSLKNELNFLERYLELQRIRFQDRLTVVMDVDAETLNAEVPNLILQPIVENTIRHGVEVSSEPVRVVIRARRQGELLQLEIEDDGPGFSESGREGVGLTNTRQRLERLYGEQHRFTIGNGASKGVVAVLDIPFRSSEEAA